MRALLLLLWLFGVAATAQEPDRRADLEAIRDEIADLQVRLTRVFARKLSVADELERTELSLALQSKRVEEARAARRLAEEGISALERRIGGLESRLGELRGALRRQLSDLYRLGRQGYLRLLLSIRQRRHLLPGIRQLRYLVRRDARLLASVLDTRVEIDYERELLLDRRREVETWIDQESSRMADLARLRRGQARLMAEIERERQSLATAADRLIDKERKLSNLLAFLVGRAPEPLAGTPMQRFRGALDWPVRGAVEQGFGPRRDPVYRTEIPHNGIDLVTRAGSPVRTVFPGTVVFAAPFRGYGMTAVVHHPGRVFTLYAGLQKLQVGQDDVLTLGQALGLASERLYFEIRVENRPEDPLEWLR